MVAKKIIENIFTTSKVGDVINTNDYTQIIVWRRELMPIIKCLQKKGYLTIRYGRQNIMFKIKKQITKEVLQQCY